MVAENIPLSPYLAELATQRKIVLVAILALLGIFFGIKLDRSLIEREPAAFLARAEPPALEEALPAAFYTATPARRPTRARSAPRGQPATLPEIFGAAAPASGAAVPDALAAPGPGSTGSSVLPTGTQTTLADGGQFIGLPGGGGGLPGTPGATLVPDPGPPAVPEPETWAMIALGMGLSGWILRRRRQREGAQRILAA